MGRDTRGVQEGRDIAWAAATGALSAAERSYPTSKVRGRSQENPMPEGQRQRGTTQHLRSGEAARRSHPESEVRGSWEEPPHRRRRA